MNLQYFKGFERFENNFDNFQTILYYWSKIVYYEHNRG